MLTVTWPHGDDACAMHSSSTASAQPFADLERRVDVGARQQQRELLAAVARRQIVVAGRGFLQQLADPAQADVAFDVAVAIVEQLEVVDVDHQQRDRATELAGALPFGGEPRVEAAPVGEAGQRVARRELLQVAVGGAQLAARARRASAPCR